MFARMCAPRYLFITDMLLSEKRTVNAFKKIIFLISRHFMLPQFVGRNLYFKFRMMFYDFRTSLQNSAVGNFNFVSCCHTHTDKIVMTIRYEL